MNSKVVYATILLYPGRQAGMFMESLKVAKPPYEKIFIRTAQICH
jgi:hypothetical protein